MTMKTHNKYPLADGTTYYDLEGTFTFYEDVYKLHFDDGTPIPRFKMVGSEFLEHLSWNRLYQIDQPTFDKPEDFKDGMNVEIKVPVGTFTGLVLNNMVYYEGGGYDELREVFPYLIKVFDIPKKTSMNIRKRCYCVGELLWTKPPKEVTMTEVNEKFGCKVKIVEGD